MSETKALWEHEGFSGRIRVLFNEDASAPMVEMKTDGGDWHYIAEGSFSLGAAMVDLLNRLRALESLVRAADRMRAGGSAALDMTKEWHGGLCSCRKCKVRDELGLSINDYDTQRAAVGEIGEE